MSSNWALAWTFFSSSKYPDQLLRSTTWLLIQWECGGGGYCGQCMRLSPCLVLVPRLRISGAVLPFLPCDFMACSGIAFTAVLLHLCQKWETCVSFISFWICIVRCFADLGIIKGKLFVRKQTPPCMFYCNGKLIVPTNS